MEAVNRVRNPVARKSVLVWLVSFLAVAIAIATALGAPELLRLQRRNARAAGVVTRAFPENQSAVVVRYSAGGRSYERLFAPYLLSVGAPVTVYYDSAQPEVAALTNPREILLGQLPVTLLGSFLAACCCTAAFYSFARRPAR